MGRPMAQNLLSKGVDLIVYDVNSSSTKEFPKIARSIQDLCQNSSIIITMLPNGDKVQRVYEDHDGILASANKKSLLIDCSTIEFDVAQKLNEKAKKMDLEMVDAPVSGGKLISSQQNLYI